MGHPSTWVSTSALDPRRQLIVVHITPTSVAGVANHHVVATIALAEGPLHTRDREPMTTTLQALSLVEKAEPVQVRLTLRLRDWRSMWMQDGCTVYVEYYMASNGSCFMVTWTFFKKPHLGSRPNTRPGDHGTSNAHNRWFILFYHAWRPAWIEIHWNSTWLRARSHMVSHYTPGYVTTLHWTHSFELSQCHGHGSWLMCEVALSCY